MRTRSSFVLIRLGLVLALLAAAPAASAAARAQGPAERQSVLLELDTEPAAPAWHRAAEGARREQRSAAETRRAAAEAGRTQRQRAASALDQLGHVLGRDARVLYRTQTLLTGLAVDLPAARLPLLRALPGVRAVHPITLKQPSNGHSVPLTGAPAVWDGPPAVAGSTGEGVTIGIIDSGIDYTHADFGGPGTEAAYRAVDGTRPAPAALFPNAKVVGGADLVGDDYNPEPGAPNHQPVPHPDPNPLDCDRNGHGTHVAGTAAGYGVAADGSGYRGPYRPGLAPAAFRVGPGAAPGARLYPIRVFGCQGSTDQLAHALDLAADPDQDGDLSDHLDVVNLSLGSGFGDPQDADAVAADRLAEAGTVVVASAGNDGDVFGVGGSPGVAARAIAVAASVGGHGDADGVRVLAPATLAGVLPAHWSARYPSWSSAEVAGVLARPVDQADGCAPFSAADGARLRGRVALLDWTVRDADRACGSAPRVDQAAAAGAVGVLLAADGDHLGEITGDERIPAAILARADGDRLRQAVAAGEVRVQLAAPGNPLHGSVAQDQPERVDTLAAFSSRGLGADGVLKPDLAAPGETIWSAKAGSGSLGTREDGTSMAAPHITGIAALVRAAHRDWTVAQVKAALMNTATDLWAGDGRSGPVLGPERAGAGRVRADLAVATPAIAYAAEPAGAVGLSFGPVPVSGPAAPSREVVVQNLSAAPLSYTTGYQPATELPGARFEPTPERITLGPGESARVRVTLRVAGRVDRAPDPSLALTQAGRARSYRGELSGQLLLTPAEPGPPTLRVPLFAAPRPASELTAVQLSGGLLALAGTPALTSTGTASLVSAFALGAEAPRWPDCPGADTCASRPGERAAALRAVGAATDSPTGGGLLYLAAVSWAPAASPVGASAVRASLDTDGDGVADAVVLADRLRGSDVLVARLLDARTGRELDVQPLNGRWGDTDTDLLDSDAVLLPVRLAALPGLAPGGGLLRYAVWTGPTGGPPEPGQALSAIGFTDGHPALEFDTRHPALDVRLAPDEAPAVLAAAHPGTTLEVRRAGGAEARLLLIHHLNPDGRRAELLTLPAQ
ncbi:S8 family serine peptidase [Kitasatospora azatica]|uniref:S8 family serine peptidase n=1 Tax=Kitasatospora azatica TaxID=58347 RepID=UPI00068EF7EC|nr:S8 family serine peptidase [Kitasatospora azatica]